ncbi:MAG: phage shock protein PspA [Pseudomonadota bacterium]|nr:phage shock protein PspA [Pseudomonadota bacterium]
MGIFSRLTDIVNSNLNAILSRAEDPAKIIRLIIHEMEDTLVEVRSSSVRTIAERKELERRVAMLRRDHDEWERKAELAVTKDRDDLAKGALQAKSRVAQILQDTEQQLAHVVEALNRQNEDVGKLQTKLNDARARQRSIAARHKSAANRIKLRTKLHDERITDAFARFEQVERALDEAEGKVEAFDIGRKKALSEEFAEMEAESGIQEELTKLKARLGNRIPVASMPQPAKV